MFGKELFSSLMEIFDQIYKPELDAYLEQNLPIDLEE